MAYRALLLAVMRNLRVRMTAKFFHFLNLGIAFRGYIFASDINLKITHIYGTT